MKKEILIGICLLLPAGLWGQLPDRDPQLNSEERAKDLISRLTLSEKAALETREEGCGSG